MQIFIAELGQTFRAPEGFRVFAAQNPLQEGGGRRGLPKSFLNRFTRVHVDLLQPEDLVFIAGASPAAASLHILVRSQVCCCKEWCLARLRLPLLERDATQGCVGVAACNGPLHDWLLGVQRRCSRACRGSC